MDGKKGWDEMIVSRKWQRSIVLCKKLFSIHIHNLFFSWNYFPHIVYFLHFNEHNSCKIWHGISSFFLYSFFFLPPVFFLLTWVLAIRMVTFTLFVYRLDWNKNNGIPRIHASGKRKLYLALSP